MKKLIAFLMALGMVMAIIPTESAQGRGRGGGRRSGGISRGSRGRSGRSRDKKLQELRERRKLEDEDSLLRDRTRERRDRSS